jgi:A1 cistron-splicing factor AAR2
MAQPPSGGSSSTTPSGQGPTLNSSVETPIQKQEEQTSLPLDTEASFHVIVNPAAHLPIPEAPAGYATPQEQALTGVATFIQNQIAIQRSPSTTSARVSELARQASVRSAGSVRSSSSSNDPTLSPPTVINTNVPDEDKGRRGRTGSYSSITLENSMSNCTIGKTNSQRSTHSVKSVMSVHAVGTFPIGSLRVHSPSPTRSPNCTSHACQKSGDVFVVRDVPAGVTFGVDSMGFSIKEGGSFDGIRYLQPGAHFIWGGSNTKGDRNGFWIMSKKLGSDDFGDVYIKRWNKYDEALEEEDIKAEAMIQRDTLPEYFDTLMEYNLPVLSTVPSAYNNNLWQQMTSCIKGSLLSRVTGYDWNKWQVSTQHEYTDKAGHKAPREWDAKKVLSVVFPKDARTFTKDSKGSQRTEQAIDTSAHTIAIIRGICSYEDSDEIIGELQFCYITGMLLGNEACMEQWGHIMKIVFKAHKLVLDDPAFGLKLVEATHAIFLFDEQALDTGSIFEHDPSLEDHLKKVFISFKAYLDEKLLALGGKCSAEQKALGKAFSDFEAYLWKRGWELRKSALRSGKVQLEDGEYVDVEADDDGGKSYLFLPTLLHSLIHYLGEYEPVIVELDEDGREKGLIVI